MAQPCEVSAPISIELTSLNAFVDFTLTAAVKVREVLQAECDEANFILRPWIIESIITRDVDGLHCTCNSPTDEQRAGELATDIDKTIAQAQQLRQKLSQNIIKNKRRQQPTKTLQEIYTPVTSKTSISAKCGTSQCSLNKNSTKKQSTKNFIAANKSSVRAISQKNSQIAKDNAALTLKTNHPSISELDNLIKKVSLDIEQKHGTTLSTLSKDNCPCHGKNKINIVTERKRVTIDLIDGLDQFGIPDYLLKILRVYHSYRANVMNAHNKDRPAARKFCANLDKINETQLDKNHLNFLVQGFSELYRNLYKTDDSLAYSRLKKKYSQLDILSKSCNIKKYDTLKTKKIIVNENCENLDIGRGWLSNGIWNWANLHDFSRLNQIPWINYTNKSQLLLLFDTSQRLQLSLYRHNLYDLLLNNIIPKIKQTVESNSQEYIKLYKMIFAIAQVINPKLPVLVKTGE